MGCERIEGKKDLFSAIMICFTSITTGSDAFGDKRATEDQTLMRWKDALEDLLKLVRKLTSANFSNILDYG